MMDLLLSCTTGAVIVGLIASQVVRKSFDPFAPIWLFLAGFAQVYVVQAISYRDYALRVRGSELVTAANVRALWALLWFLLVYYSGIGKKLAARLPRAPSYWSPGLIATITPFMFVWGLICSGIALHSGEVSGEENLLRQFPIMMLASGVLLVVTGRQPSRPRPAVAALGIMIVFLYIVIWMYHGRRSHAVIGVLTGVCAFYVPTFRRPSMPVMMGTALACALAVSLALGWRNNIHYERSFTGFVQYLGDFDPSTMLVNLNLKEKDEGKIESTEQSSKETEEYGGYLLMLYAVPELSEYDYGAPYLRVFSTYIPRLVWPTKPIFGREQWVHAWMAGSEFRRDENFTGPAISVLGAAQLNGGAIATVIVMAILALMLRTGYDYYRFYADCPWAQAWWALTYYVAWLMTVNDDPLVWFYYIYGHTTLPPLAALWIYHRVQGSQVSHEGLEMACVTVP